MFIRNKKNLKEFHTAFQKFINKISKKNSTRLHDEFFGLKILETFTKAFLLKLVIWIFFKYCQVIFLKTKKIFIKKMQDT